MEKNEFYSSDILNEVVGDIRVEDIGIDRLLQLGAVGIALMIGAAWFIVRRGKR